MRKAKLFVFLCQNRHELLNEAFRAAYQRALSLREQHLGLPHPETAQTLHDLALLYRDQGKYVEAEPLYRQALHIQEQVLGPTHSETAETLHDLGIFFQKQGELYEAFSLVERALEIRSQSLGEGHPKTMATQALCIQLVQDLKITQ
nr:tetratricopeptide repeat protein [Ktedonobacter sp. SOSP1-85]